jgi:hypothetical protein
MITNGMTYGLAALAVGIYSIPLLFILWRVVKAPIRNLGPPSLFPRRDSADQGASELIGTDGITALIYILAGVRPGASSEPSSVWAVTNGDKDV